VGTGAMTPNRHSGQERDIDLVLVTGAGASREFGLQGKPLPLMADWSEAIIKKLTQANSAYLALRGQAWLTTSDSSSRTSLPLHATAE